MFEDAVQVIVTIAAIMAFLTCIVLERRVKRLERAVFNKDIN